MDPLVPHRGLACTSDVGYDVNGFLEKNRDTLFGDLIATSQSSKLKLLKDIFPDEYAAFLKFFALLIH